MNSGNKIVVPYRQTFSDLAASLVALRSHGSPAAVS